MSITIAQHWRFPLYKPIENEAFFNVGFPAFIFEGITESMNG